MSISNLNDMANSVAMTVEYIIQLAWHPLVKCNEQMIICAPCITTGYNHARAAVSVNLR